MNKKKFLIITLCIIVIAVAIIAGVILLAEDDSNPTSNSTNKKNTSRTSWKVVSEVKQNEKTIVKIALEGYYIDKELIEVFESYGKEDCIMWFFQTEEDAKTLESYNFAELKKENGEYKIHRYGEETEEEKAERLEREKQEEAEKKAQEEAEFKASCSTYTYKEMARNPETFEGTNVKLTGEVIQAMYDKYSVTLRVNITKTGNYSTYYTDTIYVTYSPEAGESKILEDDIITLWGTSQGDKTYTSTMGAQITIPHIKAKYITIEEE